MQFWVRVKSIKTKDTASQGNVACSSWDYFFVAVLKLNGNEPTHQIWQALNGCKLFVSVHYSFKYIYVFTVGNYFSSDYEYERDCQRGRTHHFISFPAFPLVLLSSFIHPNCTIFLHFFCLIQLFIFMMKN